MDGPVLVYLSAVGVIVGILFVLLVVVVWLGGGPRAGNNMQEGSIARKRGK
jgi:hypothetical protein